MITVDLNKAGVQNKDIDALYNKITELHKNLRKVDGSSDNGWVNLPDVMLASNELAKIKQKAEWVRKNCDVMLVIGVGGSYIGAAAGLEMLKGDFPIEFLGTSFDAQPVADFMKKWATKRVCVNIVSKSGTTMEIMAAFNIIDSFMQKKYPLTDEYRKHIVITTDVKKGYLREFADIHNIETFAVPDFVGGRFSVLSAVGLFPLAVGGIDIKKVLDGAKKAENDCCVVNCEAYKYAAARYLLYKGKSNEVLVSFYESMSGLLQWWQQLFGESEGKSGKGLFPSGLIYSRDLHSMGQYIQQGTPLLFETFVNVKKTDCDLVFEASKYDAKKLPAKSFAELNRAAFLGTVKAHSDAGVPVVILNLNYINAESLGYLIYFFETACAISAGLLGVNPFDQPGVECYKKEMRNFIHKC